MANTTLKYWMGIYPQFIGSATILNNGVTPNSFTIGITNNNPPGADSTIGQIIIDETTPIYLWFIVDNNQSSSADHNRNWALTTQSQLYDDAVKINFIGPDGNDHTGDWATPAQNQPSGSTLYDSMAGWKLVPKAGKPATINPGETLRLIISGLVTNLPDGDSTAYFAFPSPILDNPDHLSTLQICYLHKTPNIIRGDKVGIGVVQPKVSLDVNGGIRAKGGPPGPNGENNNGYFFNGIGDDDSGMSGSAQGQVEFYVNSREAMRIVDKNGTKIGLAIMDPKSLLHLAGQPEGKQTTLRMDGKNTMELGGGLTKEANAGKIGYQIWTDGLDIVGAGKEANLSDRKITLHTQGGMTVNGSTVVNGNQETKGEFTLHDGAGNGTIYIDPTNQGGKGFNVRSGNNQQGQYNNIISAGKDYFRLYNDARPMYYHEYPAVNHDYTNTNISSDDYIAIIAGWEAIGYDVQEKDRQNWGIYMIPIQRHWHIYINMPNNGSKVGTWTVRVMAFHRSLGR